MKGHIWDVCAHVDRYTVTFTYVCVIVCVCLLMTPLSCFFPRDQWWLSHNIRTSRAAFCSCGSRGLQGPEERMGWMSGHLAPCPYRALCSLEKGGSLKMQGGWG